MIASCFFFAIRHPEVRGAKRRASKGDGPGAASFEARAVRGHLRMTNPEFASLGRPFASKVAGSRSSRL